MFAVVGLWLCLSVLVPGQTVTVSEQSHSLWSFEEPGDIVLHGLFPIRKRIDSGEGFGLNFEGVTWMGSMIHRIRQINQEKLLPGNLTLGYAIRDTSSDVKTGLRQTLSVLHTMLNKEGSKQYKEHVPVVVGPATDEIEDTSERLFKLFDVPRVAYTTTSCRFGSSGKMIRTVSSDLIHIEALLRLLNDTKALEVSVVVSKSSPWKQRMDIFQTALTEAKSRTRIQSIVYVNASEYDVADVLRRISGKVIVLFAESNISRTLIRKEKKSKDRTWIKVCAFDDPLIRVFDTFGKLTKKVIIRNARTKDVDGYRSDISRVLRAADKIVRPNWLSSVFEKHCNAKPKLSKASSHNESSANERECFEFRKRIISTIGKQNEFQSSLTLQGIIDAVNLIIASVRDTLEQCGESTPRDCPKLTAPVLFMKMRKATVTNEAKNDFDSSFTIQVLRRVEDAMLGKRTKMSSWTYRKLREWRLTRSYVRDRHRMYWDDGLFNTSHKNNAISIRLDSNQTSDIINSSHNFSCIHCSELVNQSKCITNNAVINWRDTWAIVLLFLECFCLMAVLLTFVYFSQHKSSPIMILCYSWPDNIILAVLCVFSLLPMMHIGHMASHRCITLWPIVNVIFAFYCGLLLTKTLFVQNLLKCEVATERPDRRMAFTALITLIQVLILASLLIFDFPKTTYLACSSRKLVTICNVEENISILVSMVFNWLLMCSLFALSATETLKQRQNFCRTENLVAVATVALLSYTSLTALAYFNTRLEHYLAVTLVQCVIYLVNSLVCLSLIYVPTLRLVSTWLRQHTRQKKNLTSIKRAQVMSSKRQSSGPMRDSVFGTVNFSPDQLTIPSGRHSGYYFDLRPASAVTDMSYPTSLIRSVHEQTHVVFGYGRRGPMSLNGGTSMESVPSVDWLEAPSQAHSASSSYDNLSQAAVEAAEELSPQELLHEISTYWERHRSSDVIANGQNEDNIETNKWPSLEKLRTSDL